jgi:AcrR family transcriptional regulator
MQDAPPPAAPAQAEQTSRRSGQRRDSTQKAIRDASISMFSEYGYHAVTLRKLADRIGIQAGSLYNHIENKQQLLADILYEIMSDLVSGFERDVLPLKGPEQRLHGFIRNHISFHTRRQEEVFIGNMEMRSLSEENRAKLVALRDRYQQYLIDILREGQQGGVFEVYDVRMVAFAILGMLNAVANWFRPDGSQSAEDIVAHYTRFVAKMVARA